MKYWISPIRMIVLVTIGLTSGRMFAQTNWPDPKAASAAPLERILVKPKTGQSLATLHKSGGGRVAQRFSAIGDLQIIEVPAGMSSATLLAQYQQSDRVQYAERDHVVHALTEPNDFNFQNGDCWHLKNLGQYGGAAGADIDAADAWATSTSAAGIVVAVLDTGVRYTHQDIAPNLWHNPGEIAGNGIDDDGNGYVDDVFGINTIANNGNPNDDSGHGTHVAGIIGAVGNNGVGVVGVCWQVQIMACKFLNSLADGTISDAIKCIDYARTKGAKIINLSWGNTTYNSQALYDAIGSARAAGIIVTCAAGNENLDNNVNPLFPASFDLDNIVSVLATTRRDEKASFSSYGHTTVDLGAPGDPVFSCWNSGNSSYQYLSGTSMAAPMVAGACALVWARYGSENYSQIIGRVLANVDPLPSLSGKCISGGRLNLNKALTGPPSTTVAVTASDNTAIIGTADTASFMFTRIGNTSGSLVVNFHLGGTAIRWDDYRRPEGDMPESITIPAGQSSVAMTIEAIANTTGANPETVVLTLETNASYNIGSPDSATVTILPSPPIVTVVATDDTAIIGTTNTASFMLMREGSTYGDIAVNFEFSGTAIKWDDYRLPEGYIPETFTIPAGQSSATMNILGITNSVGGNPETVVLTLISNQSYSIGSPDSATVMLVLPERPHIENIQFVAPSSVIIRWSSIPGVRYRVQGETDFDPANWQDLSGEIIAADSTTLWTNNVSGVTQRFYVLKMLD